MDKLQPIIKQRFWILLGLSLGLAFFAFFKNQAAIVEATTAKETALKATLDGIPKGTEPNKSYVEGAQVINKSYKGKIEQAVDELYARQQDRMKWPEQIFKELPKDPKGIPLYRDTEKGLSTVATRTYSRIYKEQLIEELWKKAEPVVEKYVDQTAMPGIGVGVNTPGRKAELLRGIASGQMRARGKPGANAKLKGQTILYDHPGFPKSTWQQKVYIDRQAVPQKVLTAIPSAEQVWDCQEDIWFTEIIFEAVRKLNKDADNVLKSPLKVISKIELHGGAGAGAAAVDPSMMGGDTGDGSGGMEAETMMSMAASYGAAGGIGAMGAGVQGGALAPPPVEFAPAEVFGPEAAMGAAPADGAMPEDTGDGTSMAMGMGGMNMAMPQALRWVALVDGAKFRERGFYLSVIINQQKIPDFLVHLCESAWPTQIVKFQMGPNPYKKDVGGGAMAGMYGMGYDPAGSGAYEGGGAGGMGGYGGLAAMGRQAGLSEDAMMGMMGMGGMGGGFMGGANLYPGGPPAFAFTIKDPFNGSLNQPDLVQLDIAGKITFYVSAKAAEETKAADALDTPSAPGGDQTILEEAAKQVEEAKKAEGQKGTEGTAPAAVPATGTAPGVETPASTPMPPATPEGTAPATPPAAAAPPAATPPAATPATATPEATPPAAPAPQTPAAPGT